MTQMIDSDIAILSNSAEIKYLVYRLYFVNSPYKFSVSSSVAFLKMYFKSKVFTNVELPNYLLYLNPVICVAHAIIHESIKDVITKLLYIYEIVPFEYEIYYSEKMIYFYLYILGANYIELAFIKYILNKRSELIKNAKLIVKKNEGTRTNLITMKYQISDAGKFDTPTTFRTEDISESVINMIKHELQIDDVSSEILIAYYKTVSALLNKYNLGDDINKPLYNLKTTVLNLRYPKIKNAFNQFRLQFGRVQLKDVNETMLGDINVLIMDRISDMIFKVNELVYLLYILKPNEDSDYVYISNVFNQIINEEMDNPSYIDPSSFECVTSKIVTT